jgi:hypothetical protein
MGNVLNGLNETELANLMDAAGQRAGEVMGEMPFVLVAVELGKDGMPRRAQPWSIMKPEQTMRMVEICHDAVRIAKAHGTSYPAQIEEFDADDVECEEHDDPDFDEEYVPPTAEETQKWERVAVARGTASLDQMWAEMRSELHDLILLGHRFNDSADGRLAKRCVSLVLAETQERMKAEREDLAADE